MTCCKILKTLSPYTLHKFAKIKSNNIDVQQTQYWQNLSLLFRFYLLTSQIIHTPRSKSTLHYVPCPRTTYHDHEEPLNHCFSWPLVFTCVKRPLASQVCTLWGYIHSSLERLLLNHVPPTVTVTVTARNFKSLFLTTLGHPMCKTAPRVTNLHVVGGRGYPNPSFVETSLVPWKCSAMMWVLA